VEKGRKQDATGDHEELLKICDQNLGSFDFEEERDDEQFMAHDNLPIQLFEGAFEPFKY
jgi:hypothetical protein